jgi:hypothetical protein
MKTSVSEIKRKECGYSDQLEMISFVVTYDGAERQQFIELPFLKGTTDAELQRWTEPNSWLDALPVPRESAHQLRRTVMSRLTKEELNKLVAEQEAQAQKSPQSKPRTHLGVPEAEKILRLLGQSNSAAGAELNRMAVFYGIASCQNDAGTIARRMRQFAEDTLRAANPSERQS